MKAVNTRIENFRKITDFRNGMGVLVISKNIKEYIIDVSV
jgi:hypothetical protein